MQVGVGQGCQDRLPKAAFGPVVLDRHDPTSLTSRRGDRRRVDGLDRIEVDDSGGDPVSAQASGGGDRLMESDASADQGDHVGGAGPDDLAATDRERLVGAVDDRGLATGRPDVHDAGPIDHRATSCAAWFASDG